jgi:hypothetical protein
MGRLWRSRRRSRSQSQRLTRPSFHRCGNQELRPCRRELHSCRPAVLQHTTGEFPVSYRPRRSDSSISLAPTNLFHLSPVSFNGAPPCYARALPSPPARAPKLLVTPPTVKIKRSVRVRCFNLLPPIMKPALQIGSPSIKSQPPHSRSTITIRWGGYPIRCLNLWRTSEGRRLRIVPCSVVYGPAIVDSDHETVDLLHGFFNRKIIRLFQK